VVGAEEDDGIGGELGADGGEDFGGGGAGEDPPGVGNDPGDNVLRQAGERLGGQALLNHPNATRAVRWIELSRQRQDV
jgi:hypothetical protein